MLDIHKENLQKSGLTPDTIERLMIRDVSPHKIKLNGVNSAYEIPYFQLDAKPNCFTRQRLFPPIQRNGHTQKYYQAKGTDPHPYLPPLSNLNWQAIANDPSQPIRITEGEKKAAALCQKAIACMGIGGVWNWRIKQDNNERLTCPELDQIIWQDREIEIIPDSDGWREAKLFDVLAGFYALAMDLVQRGARVKFVELPELIPGAKTGLDDWLVKKGELWHWEWESLERVSMDNPRLRKLAKWWQNWNLRQGEAHTTHLKVFHATDLGNSERFVRDHGDSLRYVHKWKKWLEWDGQRWRPDESEHILQRAKQTVRNILGEARNLEDEKERKALVGHAFKSERKDRLHALVSLATSESGIGITPDALDSNQWLLNAENGTINLRDGSLHPHQPTDYLTKILPVSYCPYATCPQWEAFLWRVLAEDQALYDFLQRAVGYALTGDTSEQCLFILYGFGQNGKSTFLEVLMDLLREYARQADFGTFLQKTQDAVRNDLARLVGMRIVAAVEADEGKRLSEVVVKQITGGDTITARFLYSEFFDYRPQFKIFLGTNHKPVIKGTDHAIWRRIRLIPFQVTIPKEEQNKHLKDELREELPGILAWAVQGCLEWQRIGLDPPAAVQQATEGYRSEMDVIGSFIADRCVVADYASIQSTSLYKTYEQWCEDNGEKPITQRELSLRIQERGFDKKHKNTGTFWEGIGLDQVEDSPGF